MGSHPAEQISGVYHRKIGDIVLTALSDGYVDGNLDLLKNVDVDQADGHLREHHQRVRDCHPKQRRNDRLIEQLARSSIECLAILRNG